MHQILLNISRYALALSPYTLSAVLLAVGLQLELARGRLTRLVGRHRHSAHACLVQITAIGVVSLGLALPAAVTLDPHPTPPAPPWCCFTSK